MVEYTDEPTATRIVTPETPNESIMFPSMAVYVHSHEPGERAELHTHAEHHVLVMRSGRMRWTLDGQTIDAAAGTVIVAPAGTDHGFEVLDGETVKLLCIESPNPERPTASLLEGSPESRPA